MPGRTMSYLKTGFLPEVLAENESDAAAAMLESWDGWERGKTRPEVVLGVLQDQGLADLLTSLAV